MTPHFVSVTLSMAAGDDLWAALSEVDRRLNVVKVLHDHMEQEEATADAAAFGAEKGMMRLGRMKETDDYQFEEASQCSGWLLSVRTELPIFVRMLPEPKAPGECLGSFIAES